MRLVCLKWSFLDLVFALGVFNSLHEIYVSDHINWPLGVYKFVLNDCRIDHWKNISKVISQTNYFTNINLCFLNHVFCSATTAQAEPFMLCTSSQIYSGSDERERVTYTLIQRSVNSTITYIIIGPRQHPPLKRRLRIPFI